MQQLNSCMETLQEFSFPEMKHTFADFFCGCGGLSLGFIQAGLKCIAAMDRSEDALQTYWYNLCYNTWSHLWIDQTNEKLMNKIQKQWDGGKTQNFLFKNGIPDNWLQSKEPMPCLNLFCYSIMDIEPEQFMKICGVNPGDISVFAGGPPCQGFSTANVNRSMYDERNKLPLRFIYYCKVCKPKIVFMENVPGLLSLGKKKGDKEGPFVIWLREAFYEAGYHMEYKVHNCADFGVPQNRRRVIFIATRIEENISFDFPAKTHGDDLLPNKTVLEAIGHLPPIEAGETYTGKAYGYNKKVGYVICPKCLKYNKEIRKNCHNCNFDLNQYRITGGVYLTEFGKLIDCQNSIYNK